MVLYFLITNGNIFSISPLSIIELKSRDLFPNIPNEVVFSFILGNNGLL